jgi:hypothetical protein
MRQQPRGLVTGEPLSESWKKHHLLILEDLVFKLDLDLRNDRIANGFGQGRPHDFEHAVYHGHLQHLYAGQRF